MSTSFRSLIFAFALAVTSLFGPSSSAQTVINSVPYTISASGAYVLGQNLVAPDSGDPAITISAPNVQLDLNGFFLSGPGADAASVPIIVLVEDVANVSIRNGLVSNGAYGIFFEADTNGRNYRVENVTFSRLSSVGVQFVAEAPGSLVRNCAFSNFANAKPGNNFSLAAIFTSGGVRIEKNSIANVTAMGSGTAYGIRAAKGDFSVGNTISNCQYGVRFGTYLNNLTSGCTTPFADGTNATGNN